MPGYLTLFLTAALLFKPCIAFGSSVDDDDNPESILIAQIARRSGDPALFLKDQQETFKQLSCEELSKALVSKVYDGVLSDKTDHGKTYKSIGPKDIFNLHIDEPGRLKLFELRGVELCIVPLKIKYIEKITVLNIMHTHMIIPPDLSHLINLKHLNLNNNRLTIPPNVSMLSQLRTLNLIDNQLSQAPNCQKNPILCSLKLSRNPLKHLPNLEGMTQLTEIIMPDHMCDDPKLISMLNTLNEGKQVWEKIELEKEVLGSPRKNGQRYWQCENIKY